MQPSPAELAAIERYEALAQLWGPDAHLIRADPVAVGRLAASVAECFIGVAEIGDSNTGFLINRWMLEIKVRPPAYWCLVAVQKWYQLVSEICGMPDLLPNNTASTQTLAALTALESAWGVDATRATELAVTIAAEKCFAAIATGFPITRPEMPTLPL